MGWARPVKGAAERAGDAVSLVLIIARFTFRSSGNLSGITSGTVGFSGRGRASRVQAGGVRRPRRGRRARRGAGRDAQADRELRWQTRFRAADALSTHSAEHDPRPFPSPEGPLDLDHAFVS